MASKQIADAKSIHIRRWDIKLDGHDIIKSNTIKDDSMVFLTGTGLLIEGIDHDYSIKEGEIELHIDNFKGKILTIINQ